MKKILSIVVLIFCCFFLVSTGISGAVNIDEVDCPCGCGMKAITCLCGKAVETLIDAGFTVEDIEKYLNSHAG